MYNIEYMLLRLSNFNWSMIGNNNGFAMRFLCSRVVEGLWIGKFKFNLFGCVVQWDLPLYCLVPSTLSLFPCSAYLELYPLFIHFYPYFSHCCQYFSFISIHPLQQILLDNCHRSNIIRGNHVNIVNKNAFSIVIVIIFENFYSHSGRHIFTSFDSSLFII